MVKSIGFLAARLVETRRYIWTVTREGDCASVWSPASPRAYHAALSSLVR